MTSSVLLRATRTLDGRVIDARVRPGAPLEVADRLEAAGEDVVVAAGDTMLLPGLHDHHLHLLAMAAARGSVRCGPDDVGDRDGLAEALLAAPCAAGGWIRGVGYHDEVAGPLDRDVLDHLVPDRPVRIQDSSGACWILNTLALRELERFAAGEAAPAGLERRDGRATGRLWREDSWLRRHLPRRELDLKSTVDDLLAYGITGVTDATPDLSSEARDLLVRQVGSGQRGLRLHLLGADPPERLTAAWRNGRVTVGASKVVLADHRLPHLPDLVVALRAHRRRRWSGAGPRPVAVHCVTRVALVLLLAALEEVGPVVGDRIEHGSVIPPELDVRVRALGCTVVTQPSFVTERGDRYLREVDPHDLAVLYRHGTLREQVPVAVSSDAPYATGDPWATVRAAQERETRGGVSLGAGECVPAEVALRTYLTDPCEPAGSARQIRTGVRADLCLVRSSNPWNRRAEVESPVEATWIDGCLVPADRSPSLGTGGA